MKHVGVVGSRSFDDFDLLSNHLDMIFGDSKVKIISGGAKGADTLAVDYAKMHGIPYREFYPDYIKYTSDIAPFIRNQEIVDHSDFIVAFWDGKSKGTVDTINKAKKQNKHVIKVLYKELEKLLTL